VFGISASTLQTAIPATLAVLTGLIGFFKVNNRAGRLREQIKDSLELCKLAEESNSAAAKEKIEQLIVEQIKRLEEVERKNANRQYSGSTLGGSLIVAVPLGFLAWLFFTLQWTPAPYIAWTMTVICALILIIGIAGFFSPPKSKSKVQTTSP
jgi:Flp pilus assembly protein TadB